MRAKGLTVEKNLRFQIKKTEKGGKFAVEQITNHQSAYFLVLDPVFFFFTLDNRLSMQLIFSIEADLLGGCDARFLTIRL